MFPSKYLQISAIFCIIFQTFGWPDGAPCQVVDTMTPNHKGGRFERRPPYRIRIGAACYRPGISIPVSLKGRDRTDRFKGFSLQARRADDQTQGNRVGEFLDSNSRDMRFQCGDSKSSITHKWKDDKYSITAQWHAQDDAEGAVRFVATVVKSYSTYWVQQVKSRKLKPCSDISTEVVETTKKPATTAPATVPVIESETEENKPKGLCDLSAQLGYCDEPQGYQQRWYHYRGFCYKFWYAGCNGNENNFQTEAACKTKCVKPVVEVKEDPTVCKLSTDQGDWCKPPGWSRKYTFNGAVCVEFRYGGCGGNSNRFDSFDECKHTCVEGSTTTSCLRFKDKDQSCAAWIQGFNEGCDEIGGSGVIRNLCQRSCCEHLKNRAA